MKPFELVNASTLQSALAQLRDKRAVLKAGGVDVLDLMKEGVLAPARLVNLRGASGLDAIAGDAKSGLAVGPLVTLARLAADKTINGSAAYRALSQAAAAAATPQIRNSATLGGNLCQRPRCWYFRSAAHPCLRKGGKTCFALDGENAHHAVFDNDSCAIVHPSAAAVALVALGATLELSRASSASKSTKRAVAAADFFVSPSKEPRRENVLRPGELISAVKLPAAPPARRSAYLKQKHKQSFDWPLAEVAVSLDVDAAGKVGAARVVLGAAAPLPWRAKAAEQALLGKRLDATSAAAAAKAALEGASPLSDNGYKVALLETLVRRALLAAAGAGTGTGAANKGATK